MNKRRIFTLVSVLMVTVFTASGAWAVGIGFYGTGGIARDSLKMSGSPTIKSNDYFYGGGLILETVSAKDELFGYRLKLEYNQFNAKEPDSGIELKGFNFIGMYHTFGFGVIRTPNIRFWIGPQLGLNYTWGSKTIKIDQGDFISNLLTPPIKIRLDAVGLDFFLALGLNINMGSTATLFFDLGAGYMGKFDTSSSGEGHAIGFKASLGFLFRVNDNYRKK